MLINEFFSDPIYYFTVLAVVIVSVVLHELGHGYTASWEGDRTPAMLGHLTWDPRVHMGWLSLALAAVLGIAFGRTPVQPRNFRHRRWGDVLVSFAGPAVNLIIAFAAAGVVVAMKTSLDADTLSSPWLSSLLDFWGVALFYNCALFLFNMMPVPPFDGFSVLNGTVYLGALGENLRRWHPWPMVIVFLAASQHWFWAIVQSLSTALAAPWLVVF